MDELTYPTIPCELDKSYKFCDKDVDNMIVLREKGLSYPKIAKIFNIGIQSVQHIFNASQKRKHGKITKKAVKDRYHNDPVYREKVKKRAREFSTKRYHTDAKFKKYKLQELKKLEVKKKLMEHKNDKK